LRERRISTSFALRYLQPVGKALAGLAVYTPVDRLTMSLAVPNQYCIALKSDPADSGPLQRSPLRFQQKLALVIPTLREAGNIHALLCRVRNALDALELNYEILVVDDESHDGTAEIVSAIAQKDSRVRLLVRKGQKGLSGAVLHGWMHTDAAILGAMDADLQHPPELLPELASGMFSGCDLVIGSRYAAGGGLDRWNPARKLLSAAAVWMAAPVQRVELRTCDPMSGFFFVRRECLAGIQFQQEGFKLLLEILVRARIRSVKEIPFAFGRRYRGASKANLKVACDYIRLLARLYRTRLGSRRIIPIELF
jgi:dolichol-phosphate mannosyltransferase